MLRAGAVSRIFFAEVAKIPAKNFCELRYEDLIRAPATEMSRIYQQLGRGSFEQLQPKLKAHLGELNGYKSNQHRMSDQQRAAVSRRWSWYMDRFGYRAAGRAQTAKSQEKRHGARELIPA
jgi:omega-hydroxy-beta-dihydromenaquinone-9 sulfotransferase